MMQFICNNNIENELTYYKLNEIFSLDQHNMFYNIYMNKINFKNITHELYIYSINLTKTRFKFFVNKINEFNYTIKNKNLNITYLTSKQEVCKNRITVLSDIVLSLNIILNTSFKIKIFLEKLLSIYDCKIMEHYFKKYSLIIDEINKFCIRGNNIIIKSVNYLQSCQNDYREILELFPIGSDIDE